MTLKLPTEKQRLEFYGFTERYVIGSSPIEKMYDAVRMEYETGIMPLVLRSRKNLITKQMETYGSYMVLHSLKGYLGVNSEKSPDGCLSDIMVNIEKFHQLYMGIQVKTTTDVRERIKSGNSTYGWKFEGTNKNYSGFLMYLRSLEDGYSWLIPYNITSKIYKSSHIQIQQSGISKNIKWENYKVSNQELGQKILEYYMEAFSSLSNMITFQTKDALSLPVRETTKLEHANRKRFLPFLEKFGFEIKSPIVEDSPYDMVVGQLKIQEKTALNTEKRIHLTICHQEDGKNSSYSTGMFHILLVHLPAPFEKYVYFIPELKLIQHGCSKTLYQKGKQTIHLYPDPDQMSEKKNNGQKDEWPNEYLFCCNDPNIVAKMLLVYNMQLSNKIVPMVIENPLSWNFKCGNMNDLVAKWNMERTYPVANNVFSYFLYGKKTVEKILTRNVNSFRLLTNYLVDDVKQPYKLTDADYFFARMPKDHEDYKNTFYLLPTKEMLRNGVLKSDITDGQLKIVFPPKGNIKTKHSWTENFLFSYHDVNIKNKILDLFRKYE
jgi:hypothetical protein